MLPVVAQVPDDGSYNSATFRATPVVPPATSTFPFSSKDEGEGVSVWMWMGVGVRWMNGRCDYYIDYPPIPSRKSSD
jgi:hypothetical protein